MLQALETSLAAIVFMHDGNTSIPQSTASPIMSTMNVLQLVENKTKNFKTQLNGVQSMLKKLDKQNLCLHRPNQGQMVTSGAQIEPEGLKECVTCAMAMFQLANEIIPKQ